MDETDLKVLMPTMEPALFPVPYGFAVGERELPDGAFAMVAEVEGLTPVAPLAVLEAQSHA